MTPSAADPAREDVSGRVPVERSAANRFRRGQMEWALWNHFSLAGAEGSPQAIPAIFRNRIKRLVEIDREVDTPVFTNEPAGAQGIDACYSRFNVFLLGLALDFLDAGFKQSDAHFLIRHAQAKLWDEWRYIMSTPPVLGARSLAKDRPRSPVHPNGRHADTAVFLLVRKSEIREAWDDPDLPDPFIIGPQFCHGLAQLMNELARLNFKNRSAVILEIAETAVSLNACLDRAPRLRRGRKRRD